ncbi:hypothetical protein LCGC14_1040730 [marine sediment metagenome]|uniref:Uncharacterized protein n=1 Tax=marine sediment metagenome TaxID=412755 RepID=A0A0F9QXZ1_9ZZZZ
MEASGLELAYQERTKEYLSLKARVEELEKAGFQLGEMLDYRVKRIMELEVELNRCLGSLGVLLATEGHVANWDGVRGIIEQAARVAK